MCTITQIIIMLNLNVKYMKKQNQKNGRAELYLL